MSLSLSVVVRLLLKTYLLHLLLLNSIMQVHFIYLFDDGLFLSFFIDDGPENRNVVLSLQEGGISSSSLSVAHII